MWSAKKSTFEKYNSFAPKSKSTSNRFYTTYLRLPNEDSKQKDRPSDMLLYTSPVYQVIKFYKRKNSPTIVI